MSTTIQRGPGTQPTLGAKLQGAKLVGTTQSVASAKIAAEALYEVAFASLAKGAPASELASTLASPERRVEAEPVFGKLFDNFVGAEKPSGPIAKDFTRETPASTRAADTAPAELVANELASLPPQDVPKELRSAAAKVNDAFFSVLEKKAGLAPGGKPLEDTPPGQWLLGPKKELLDRVAAQLAPSLRGALRQSSTTKTSNDPIQITPPDEHALKELVTTLPAGAISVDADISSCIQLLFMQLGKDAELDLRDQLKTMNERIAQKKAMREYAAELRELQAEGKKQLQAEYQSLTQQKAIDCSFEQFTAMRPLDVQQPTLSQAENGKWSVTGGSVALSGGSWVGNPDAVPVALRPKADAASNEGLAQRYGLSEGAISALKDLWIESGAPAGSFDNYLSQTLKLAPAKTAAEAEANKNLALAELNKGVPGAEPPTSGIKTKVHDKMTTTVATNRDLITDSAGGQRMTKSVSDKAALTVSDAKHQALIPQSTTPAKPGEVESARRAAITALNASTPPKGFGTAAPASAAVANASGERLEGFEAKIAKAKDDMDTIADQSTLEQMAMQRYLERRSKAFEMLSNVMKKFATTSGQIIENMK